MALSNTQLAELRRQMASASEIVPWKKAVINAALEAIEDWFEVNRVVLAQAIEAAAPGMFTIPQKKRLVAFWLEQKFRREAS